MREYGAGCIEYNEETYDCDAYSETQWNSMPASEIPSVADGSLGWAAYQLTQAFGLEVPEDYDGTCSEVGAWPEPDSREYETLYMDISSGEPVGVAYHTNYSLLLEGDAKRAYMDLYAA